MTKANTNSKKKVLGIGAAICALSLAAVGSFALFTDTASVKGATTAGKLAIGITADKMTADGDFSEQLLNTDFDGANPINNFNPGDGHTVAYKISNEQSKAAYINDEITLKVTPDTAYAADGQAITAANCAITFDTADGALTEKSRSMDNGVITIVYEGKETVLSGTGANAEVVKEGIGNTANPTTAARSYELNFNVDADNAWQGAKVEISSKVDAVQYANNHGGLADKTITAESVKTNAAGKVNG